MKAAKIDENVVREVCYSVEQEEETDKGRRMNGGKQKWKIQLPNHDIKTPKPCHNDARKNTAPATQKTEASLEKKMKNRRKCTRYKKMKKDIKEKNRK